MLSGVRTLSELWNVDSPFFGNKANLLSQAMEWGVPVLPGFCITFELIQSYDVQLQNFSAQIKRAYHNLKHEFGARRLIVRSSVDLEDGESARFPGIFQSVSGVSSLSQLYEAIKSCYYSVWNPTVQNYMRVCAVKQRFQYFTALVQIELQPEFAGVASTRVPLKGYSTGDVMLASMTQGDNHDLVKGLCSGSTFSFCYQQGNLCVHKIGGESFENIDDLDCLFHSLYYVLSELRRRAGRELEVEWGYKEEKIYIFQIRYSPESMKMEDDLNKQQISLFVNDGGQGLKYQAMRFFQDNGLFPRKVLFFPHESTAIEIADKIRKELIDTPITLRFSKNDEIGLPRKFATDVDAAANFILETKQQDWSVIAYSSITVKESFELYFDQDIVIMEYMPGMWESDSILAVDTVLLRWNQVSFWLAKSTRNAKYEDAEGIQIKRVLPTSLTWMKNELVRRLPTLRKLQATFSLDVPLNIHFVSDGVQDYYLNCRHTNRISLEERYGGPVQVIESIADCGRWDGKSSILFRPKLHRGEELLLFQYIPFLKSLKVPVYVEFGILSHPAIMLREFGITIIPYFLHHNYYEMNLEEF